MTQKIEFEIPVDIDTEKISTKVAAKAEDVLINDMRTKVEKALFRTGWDGKPTHTFNEYTRSIIKECFEEHKDEIIEKAAKYLAANLAKTKAAKEVANG